MYVEEALKELGGIIKNEVVKEVFDVAVVV
jgi:hypothetical protein